MLDSDLYCLTAVAPMMVQFLFLVIMLPFTEYTKYMIRNHPESWWAIYIGW
jgi:hypothetical protein